MGESTCLMQPFSYASGLPNEANEGNPVHALAQSVSFGRFMSESLSWEKWSAFSSNRYVEEAERYARPGSVAQKKAFFEAHYKSLAARKAAALLEQAKLQAQAEEDDDADEMMNAHVQQQVQAPATGTRLLNEAEMAAPMEVDGPESLKDEPVGIDPELNEFQCSDKKCESPRKVLEEPELSETSQMEKPLLKNLISSEAESEVTSQKRQVASSLRQPSFSRASKLKPSPSPAKALPSLRPKKENHSTPNFKKPARVDRLRSTPKASQRSISFTPAKEFNKLTASIMRKMDGSRASSHVKAANDCSTPLKTPTMGQASGSGRPKHPSVTSRSDVKSTVKPHDSSVSSVSKSVRARWSFLNTDCSKIFSASRNKSQSPGIFASFTLRTEERAAKRKQKLEEKFNRSQTNNVQNQATLKKLEEKFNRSQTNNVQNQATLKAKAGTELKKLNPGLCFKARPLPDFYKERSAKKQQVKEQEEEASLKRQQRPAPQACPTPSSESSTLQRASSVPRQRSLKKNLGPKQLAEKINQDSAAQSLKARCKMATHENTSPNILQA